MGRRRMRVAVALLLLAVASFAAAFAIARTTTGGDDKPTAARPVYYGPPLAVPNLEHSRNSPPSLGVPSP